MPEFDSPITVNATTGVAPVTINNADTDSVGLTSDLIHGADVASSGTINLNTTTGHLIDVTGTTTITAITLSEGKERIVRFTGALTLTHGASLVLPGAANITTAAGDFAIFVGYAAGVVRCAFYSRAAAQVTTLANWGPFAPDSITLASPDNSFATVYDSGSSTGNRYEDMVGIAASIAADTKVECYWDLPTTLPTGTLKLRIWMRANATSGNAKINPKWACVTAEDDPGVTALSAEGVQTITWGAGDAHQYKEYIFTLVATTAVAGKRLIMSLVFETASYTLAASAGVNIKLMYQ